MLTFLMWLLIFVGGALYLAYHRISLRAATLAVAVVLVAYSVFGSGQSGCATSPSRS